MLQFFLARAATEGTVDPVYISINLPTPSVDVGSSLVYNAEPPFLFLYTSANWIDVLPYLEVCMRAVSGTAYARLYDDTDGAEVASSELSTASTTFVRLRTAALSLTDGNEYTIQLGVPLPGNEAVAGDGRVIFVE